MPWEGRKQELCFPFRSLHCPQVQCYLILAVLKYIERFILKLPGLLLTQSVGAPQPASCMEVEEKQRKL